MITPSTARLNSMIVLTAALRATSVTDWLLGTAGLLRHTLHP